MAEKGLPKFRSRLLGKGVHLKTGFGLGSPSNSPIAIVGIKPGDELMAVYELQPPTAAAGNAIVGEHVSIAVIDGVDAIRIPGVNSSGNQIMAFWWTPA